ncbi:MAG: hypothetical protein KGQ51_10110 [Planctomycetes bacterium]|nr:hypothetical protein [Planctomycetota bacterium]
MRFHLSLGLCSFAGFSIALTGWGFGQEPQSFQPMTSNDSAVPGRSGGTTNRTDGLGQPRSTTRNQRASNSRGTYVRVSRAPNMFGDTLNPGLSYFPFKSSSQSPSESQLAFTAPQGGGGSFNASENNTAIPTDRVYFIYNGFFNAASNSVGFGPVQQNLDIHRYLMGFEKTFLDGNLSIDVRMPFVSSLQFDAFGINSETGNVGNLTMYLKGLMLADEFTAFATGLGIGLPTGSDTDVTRTAGPLTQSLTIQNEAVTLMPFVASTMSLNDSWFVQSFSQILFVTSGDTVVNNGQVAGIYNQQNLLQADVGLGRWMWQDASRSYLTGLAGVVELHYTSTIQDTDAVKLGFGNLLGGEITNNENRIDLLNLTSGIHAQLGPMSALRVGAVVPLKNAPNRTFDSEIQVSFNRKF